MGGLYRSTLLAQTKKHDDVEIQLVGNHSERDDSILRIVPVWAAPI
jgi:hypothetical protein